MADTIDSLLGPQTETISSLLGDEPNVPSLEERSFWKSTPSQRLARIESLPLIGPAIERLIGPPVRNPNAPVVGQGLIPPLIEGVSGAATASPALLMPEQPRSYGEAVEKKILEQINPQNILLGGALSKIHSAKEASDALNLAKAGIAAYFAKQGAETVGSALGERTSGAPLSSEKKGELDVDALLGAGMAAAPLALREPSARPSGLTAEDIAKTSNLTVGDIDAIEGVIPPERRLPQGSAPERGTPSVNVLDIPSMEGRRIYAPGPITDPARLISERSVVENPNVAEAPVNILPKPSMEGREIRIWGDVPQNRGLLLPERSVSTPPKYAVDPTGKVIDISELTDAEKRELFRGPKEYIPRETYVRPSESPPELLGRVPQIGQRIITSPFESKPIEPGKIITSSQALGEAKQGGKISFASPAEAESIPSARQSAVEQPAPQKEEAISHPGEKIASDLGLKWGGEVRGQWQFDVIDPKDKQPIRFNVKAGSTVEEIQSKADSKLAEFSKSAPLGVITEESMLKLPPEQQFELGHKAGIQYGETLTEKSVPDLEKKYAQSKTELMDSLSKGDTKGYGAAFGRMNYYGGALMGATEGKHPISGSNYELYLKQKAAETPFNPDKGFQRIQYPGAGLKLKQSGSVSPESGFVNLDPLIDKFENVRKALRDSLRRIPTRQEMYGKLDAAENMARIYGQQMGKRVKLGLSDLQDRAASVLVAANFDKSKLPSLLAETIKGKHKEAEEAVRYAMSNWKSVEPAARLGAQVTDDQLLQENNRGINTEYHEGYLPGIYDMDLMMGKGRPFVIGSSKGGGTASGFKKGKTFETPFHAIGAGYKPRTLNLSDLVEHRVRQGQNLINRMDWGDALRNITDPTDNNPIAVSPITKTRPNGTKYETVPLGYETREIVPGMRVGVHEGFGKLFDAITGKSAIEEFDVKGIPVGKLALQAGKDIKHGLLLFDTFHAGRILRKELFLTRGIGYKKGQTLLEYSDSDLNRAVKEGDITKEMADYARANRPKANILIKEGYNVGRIQEGLFRDITKIPVFKQIIQPFNRWVFDKLTRGAMIESGIIEFERTKKNNPTWTDSQVARKVSRDLNAYFGNLGRQSIFKSRTMQDLSRLVALAPQWVEAVARSEFGGMKQLAIDPIKDRSLKVGSLGTGLATGLAAYFVVTQALNLLFRGKPTWQNEEQGHKLDAWIPDVTGKSNGYFISPFSVVAETTHDLMKIARTSPDKLSALGHFLGNKAAPMWRAGKVLLQGTDWSGKKVVGDWEKAKAAAIDLLPTPIPVSSAVKPGRSKSIEEIALQSIGEKTELAPTARNDIFVRSRDWGLGNKDKKIKHIYEQREKEQFPESDYLPLRKALMDNDNQEVVSAYNDLIANESTNEGKINVTTKILNEFNPFTKTGVKPFATRKKETEELFLQSLDKVGREQYRKAVQEQVENFRRLTKALTGEAQDPPIPEQYRGTFQLQ